MTTFSLNVENGIGAVQPLLSRLAIESQDFTITMVVDLEDLLVSSDITHVITQSTGVAAPVKDHRSAYFKGWQPLRWGIENLRIRGNQVLMDIRFVIRPSTLSIGKEGDNAEG